MEDVPPRAATVAHADDAELAGLPLGRLAIAGARPRAWSALGAPWRRCCSRQTTPRTRSSTRAMRSRRRRSQRTGGRETGRPPTRRTADSLGGRCGGVAPGGERTSTTPGRWEEPPRPVPLPRRPHQTRAGSDAVDAARTIRTLTGSDAVDAQPGQSGPLTARRRPARPPGPRTRSVAAQPGQSGPHTGLTGTTNPHRRKPDPPPPQPINRLPVNGPTGAPLATVNPRLSRTSPGA